MNKKIIITILLALAAVAAQAQEPFFCTDSAVVRGRIVDFSPAMGFQNLTVQVTDIFTGELKTATAEIREDGTFEKRLCCIIQSSTGFTRAKYISANNKCLSTSVQVTRWTSRYVSMTAMYQIADTEADTPQKSHDC